MSIEKVLSLLFNNLVKYRNYYIISIVSILLILIASFASYSYGKNDSVCLNKYKLVNKSLNCGNEKVISKVNYAAMRNRLNLFIDSKKTLGELSNASIYFLDLEDGPMMGINENDNFSSASLLKLPVVMALYKLNEEKYPGLLERKIKFSIDREHKQNNQYYKSPIKLEQGKDYAINDLIFNALVYSDNLSIELLMNYLVNLTGNDEIIFQTLKDVGLTAPEETSDKDISTRSYASLFKILYNASYLNTESSEKLLSVLLESGFNKGIATGIPENVKLANKFGERKSGEEVQLHDCGVVYYPENPYLLCIMTSGIDYKKLESVISNISDIVYSEVDSRRIISE